MELQDWRLVFLPRQGLLEGRLVVLVALLV